MRQKQISSKLNCFPICSSLNLKKCIRIAAMIFTCLYANSLVSLAIARFALLNLIIHVISSITLLYANSLKVPLSENYIASYFSQYHNLFCTVLSSSSESDTYQNKCSIHHFRWVQTQNNRRRNIIALQLTGYNGAQRPLLIPHITI